MNGYPLAVLIWLVNGLLFIVSVLIGMVVKQHLNSDKEHQVRTDKEIDLLRSKVHDIGNKFAALQMKVLKK